MIPATSHSKRERERERGSGGLFQRRPRRDVCTLQGTELSRKDSKREDGLPAVAQDGVLQHKCLCILLCSMRFDVCIPYGYG